MDPDQMMQALAERLAKKAEPYLAEPAIEHPAMLDRRERDIQNAAAELAADEVLRGIVAEVVHEANMGIVPARAALAPLIRKHAETRTSGEVGDTTT